MRSDRAVRRGVRRLDRRGPKDWFLRVNADRLDLASAFDCVLGQVYDREERSCTGYGLGLRALGIVNPGRFGFLSEPGRAEAWRRVLLARQSARLVLMA